MYKLKKVKKGDLITIIAPDKFCWVIGAPCVGYVLEFKPDKTAYFIPLSKIKKANNGEEVEF